MVEEVGRPPHSADALIEVLQVQIRVDPSGLPHLGAARFHNIE